jgi:hypothetical protein
VTIIEVGEKGFSLLKYWFVLIFLSGCMGFSGPGGEADTSIDSARGQDRTTGGTGNPFTLPNQPIDDDNFLDQYFTKYGLCEIKILSCPDEPSVTEVFPDPFVIADSTPDYQNIQYITKEHGDCLKKAMELHHKCGSKADTLFNFTINYDVTSDPGDPLEVSSLGGNGFSSTIIQGPSVEVDQAYDCEFQLSVCNSGANWKKFQIDASSSEAALNSCLSDVSERITGCEGGVIDYIKLTGPNEFMLHHQHLNQNNHVDEVSCDTNHPELNVVVDFAQTQTLRSNMAGIRNGIDLTNTTGELNNTKGTSFYNAYGAPLNLGLFVMNDNENSTETNFGRRAYLQSSKMVYNIGRSPGLYVPEAIDTTVLLPGETINEYALEADDRVRFFNGVGGKGGVLNAQSRLFDPDFPPTNQMLIEPWSKPDLVINEVQAKADYCGTGSGCEINYGDEPPGAWDTPDTLFHDPTGQDTTAIKFGFFESYAAVVDHFTRSTNFRQTDFVGPSIDKFDKTYLEEFMKYCRGKKQKLLNTEGSGTPNRGCEVNYISWHASDKYLLNMSKVARDIEYVRKTYVDNPDWALLNIKGILITEINSKTEYFIPAAMMRQMNILEQAGADGAARGCFFDSCDTENSLGGLLKFVNGTNIYDSYEKTNMWWTKRLYSDVHTSKVLTYSADSFVASYGSRFSRNTQGEVIASFYNRLDNTGLAFVPSQNINFYLKNFEQIAGYTSIKKLRIRSSTIPALYQLEAQALADHSNKVKNRGPVVSDETAAGSEIYRSTTSIPSSLKVCVPANQGELIRLQLDFVTE